MKKEKFKVHCHHLGVKLTSRGRHILSNTTDIHSIVYHIVVINNWDLIRHYLTKKYCKQSTYRFCTRVIIAQ